MKATLMSYLPGMSGDFLAFIIHQDHKFYKISDKLIFDGVKITEQNKWNFPNLLESIGLEAKIYPNNRSWTIDEDSMNILEKIYGDKQIILPSHWYNMINQKTTNNLFDRAIRLFVKEESTLKICYALWWIKSHVIAHDIWPHRQEEIDEMLLNNHKHKNQLLDMLSSYHNWKFMSIKYDLLTDGEFDLDIYIRRHFKEVYSKGNHTRYRLNYNLIDIDNIFYYDKSNLKILEDYFKIDIDKTLIDEYNEKNFNIFEKCLGFKINSPEFNNDEIYFDSIINYARDIIETKPTQIDYFKRKVI